MHAVVSVTDRAFECAVLTVPCFPYDLMPGHCKNDLKQDYMVLLLQSLV